MHEDQSIPEHIQKRIYRRDGSPPPQVKGLSLDTKFGAIDPKAGNVNLVVQGSNVPGINHLLHLTPPSTSSPAPSSSQRRSRFFKRGFFGDIGSAIGDAVGDVGDAIGDVGNAVEGAFDKFNSFDKNVTKTLTPVNVNKDFQILNFNKSCPAEEGSGQPGLKADIKADINAQAKATVTIGVVAQGSIIPPKIEDFGVFAGM